MSLSQVLDISRTLHVTTAEGFCCYSTNRSTAFSIFGSLGSRAWLEGRHPLALWCYTKDCSDGVRTLKGKLDASRHQPIRRSHKSENIELYRGESLSCFRPLRAHVGGLYGATPGTNTSGARDRSQFQCAC
jgi:hypothetical protein